MKIKKNGNRPHTRTIPAIRRPWAGWLTLLLLAALSFTGCASSQKSKVSGNLDSYSRDQVVAILPVETTSQGQRETANLFRRAIYANLTQAKYKVMERYAVDALLKKEGLTDPADYLKVSPIRLGEILGADAVIISRVNKVQRLYLVLHASIEVSVSAQMVDTRSGEVLWHADQSETAFEGLAKIPTGIIAAGYGPLQFITNKVNLFKITKGIANSITALLKNPQQANEKEKFNETVIAVAALDDFDDISAGQYAQAPGTQFAAFDKETRPEAPEIQVAKLEAINNAGVKKPSGSSQYPELELDHDAYKEKGKYAKAEALRGPAENYDDIEEETFTEERQSPEPNSGQNTGRVKTDLSEEEALLAMANTIDQEEKTASARKGPEVQLASYQPAKIKPTPSVPQKIIASQPRPAPTIQAGEEAKIARKAPSVQQPQAFFSIQVGAFKAQTSAYRMISQLSAKGYSAFINLVTKADGDSLYKVQLEKFSSKEEARRFSREFKAQEKMDNFITQVASVGVSASHS